jgi:phosphate transport system substrate-binding protein
MEFKGSSYGLGALMSGRCDIAASSRELTRNEPALAKERGIEMEGVMLGSYAVAVFVHADNPVNSLSGDQVRDIFTGAVTNWRAVGGADAPIQVFMRDQISGTHLGFQELAMEKKPYALEARPMTNYTGIVQAVEQHPHAIGYASFDFIGKPGVRPVKISLVAPTGQSVHQGLYPYARAMWLFTDRAQAPEMARRFVAFAVSEQGRKIVEQMGNVPRP